MVNVYDDDESTTTGGGVSSNGNTSFQYADKDKEQINKGTIANVTVIEGGEELTEEDLKAQGINTDLSNTQEITKDEETDMIDVNAQTQLLTEEGWNQFKEELKEAENNTDIIAQTVNILFVDKNEEPEIGTPEHRDLQEISQVVEYVVENADALGIKDFDNGQDLINQILTNYGGLVNIAGVVIFDPSNPPLDENGKPMLVNGAHKDGIIYLSAALVASGDMKEINRVIAEEAGEIWAIQNGKDKMETVQGTPAVETIGQIFGQAVEDESTNQTNTNATVTGTVVNWAAVGQLDGVDISLYHGGGPGKKEGLAAIEDRIDFIATFSQDPEKYQEFLDELATDLKKSVEELTEEEIITALENYPEINHSGWFFGFANNTPDQAADDISEHWNNYSSIGNISLGYSMSADAALMAFAGQSPNGEIPQPNKELIVVYPRIEYIEEYVNDITPGMVTGQIIIVTLADDSSLLPGYGDRSTESLEELQEAGFFNYENGVYKNQHGVEIKFVSMTEGDHGGVMGYDDKVPSIALPSLINGLQQAGTSIQFKN